MSILRRPITWAVVGLAFVVIGLVWINGKGAPGPDSGPRVEASDTVRVGYLRLLSAAPLYTALREGYFEEENLAVELRVIKSGPEGNEALAAGNIDVAFSIVPSLIVARVQGVPEDLVSIYGASIDGPEVLDHRMIVPAGSSITSAEDLAGKTIAVVGWPGRTSDVLELLDYFERHGIAQGEVTLVGMGHGDMVGALEAGVIDVAAAAEPYISLGMLAGKVETLSAPDDFYYPPDQNTEVTTYLARKSWVDSNTDVAKRFTRALEKGRIRASDREWLVTKGVPSFNAKTSPEIDFAVISPEQAEALHFMPINPKVSIEGLERVSQQLLRHGPITTVPDDLSDLIYDVDALAAKD